MIRNPEGFKSFAEDMISATLQEGELECPIRIRITIHGNVEMLQDSFADDISEIVKDRDCVITDSVCAIHDDDVGSGWTRVTFEFIQTKYLAKYIQGVEKDHCQEVRQLRSDIEALEQQVDGLTDLRPEN